MNQHQRYPLLWPTGWVRTRSVLRQSAAFKQTVDGIEDRLENGVKTRVAVKRERQVSVLSATERLERQLTLLGAQDAVLSTNVALRLDGRPRAGEKEPDDPGAAVYFFLHKKPIALACDKWNRVADNIAALAGHIDAQRRIARYGVGSLDQIFAGYVALPANTAADWRNVFGFADDVRPSLVALDEKFRELARSAHPDAGGSHLQMARLTEARAFARKELATWMEGK